MAIILEGPDASGKTTLARRLVSVGFELIAAGGSPKNWQEMEAYCERQVAALDRLDAVVDRVSPISDPIYHERYRGNPTVFEYLQEILCHPKTILIYCRPPNDILMMPEKHEWKDYDTEDHKKMILDRQMEFIDAYDAFFMDVPHLNYDYTDRGVADYLFKIITLSRADERVPKILRGLTTSVESRICPT